MNEVTLLKWEGQKTLKQINKILEDGGSCAVDDMPNETYHEHQSVSSSFLREMHRTCPKKVFHGSVFDPDREKNREIVSKLCFDLGSAAHDLVLQGDKFFEFNFVAPETYIDEKTKEEKPFIDKRGNKWKNLQKDNPDKVVLLHKEFQDVKTMADAVMNHELGQVVFQDGVAERSLFWVDDDTGVHCRCRPDFLPHDLSDIPDFKTTADASLKGVKKSIAQNLYNMQHAFYVKGIEKVYSVRPERFYFLFEEVKPPHCITIAFPDQESAKRGAQLNKKYMTQTAHSLQSGIWPEYASEAVSCTLPIWDQMELDRLEDEGKLPKVEKFWG